MDPEFKDPFPNLGAEEPVGPRAMSKVSYEQPMFPTVVMSPGLIGKLGLMVWYLDEVTNKRRSPDEMGFRSLLDDAEIQQWLSRLNQLGLISNTMFLGARKP